MMICPPCASTNVVKNGHRNGKSRYLCRDGCRQFRDHLQQGYGQEVKALCATMPGLIWTISGNRAKTNPCSWWLKSLDKVSLLAWLQITRGRFLLETERAQV